jgi:putative ABC transport system permease protein
VLTIGIPEVLDVRHTVVGVIASIKQDGLTKPAVPQAYFPIMYADIDVGVGRVMLLAIRTKGDPRRVVPEIRQIVQGKDSRIAVSEVLTMDELLWEEVARPRFLAVLLATFAGLALLLAAIGIFGVMSHSVGQRTPELGIRKALGAKRSQIHRMVLREGMLLVLVGLAIGLAAAVAINTVLAKLLADMLFEIEALDPWTFIGVPILIVVIGGLACWLPARKATRVDPMLAIRHE